MATESEQAVINRQMLQALDSIAFLPFGKLIDEWRWGVFSGEIGPSEYNEAWWELRTRYQGIAAPVERTEEHFDPGAKYHIPGNTSYTRYFLARILQFQLQRALCETAGFEGPLHECSIYGSKAAGEKLQAMLAAGASEPWQDTLAKITGTREMDATAIIDYFHPLMAWLEKQNSDRSCGW
jgi:peptidyl-dipeptidase A